MTAVGMGSPRPALSRLAVVVPGLLMVALVAAEVPLAVLARRNPVTTASETLAVVVPFAAVGIVVAWRRPGNPIGWLMFAFAACFQLSSDAGSYDLIDYRLGRGLPLGPVALLLYLLWEPGLALIPVVVLLFPDGRPPSARWRWMLRAYLAMGLTLLAVLTLRSAIAIAQHQTQVDRFGQLSIFDRTSGYGGAAFVLVGYAMLVVVWLGAVARQAVSWRRSSGDRRQQFKWLASGAIAGPAALLCSVLLSGTHGFPHAVADVVVIGVAALPVSVGVGILRYRLYDIDRIISRTLAYAIVTGLLVGVYAGLVILATQVLSFASPVAVAASTLAAAALFSPLRRRVQKLVDRRFNRARYDADRLAIAFADRLRDEVDLTAVSGDIAGVVDRALRPSTIGVWIRRSRPIAP